MARFGPGLGKHSLRVQLAWGLLGLGAAGFLLVFGGGGHPPAIIYLPMVLAVWALGHAVFFALCWLVVRVRARASAGAPPTVPPRPRGDPPDRTA